MFTEIPSPLCIATRLGTRMSPVPAASIKVTPELINVLYCVPEKNMNSMKFGTSGLVMEESITTAFVPIAVRYNTYWPRNAANRP